MKFSNVAIVAVICIALAVLVSYAVFRQGKTRKVDSESTSAFLAQERALAKTSTTQGDLQALVPGVGSKQTYPVIQLSKTPLDLGVVSHKHDTKVDYPIYNKGNADLVINSISTSCHCTEGRMEPGQQIIKPGGRGMMQVVLNPDWVPGGFHSHKQLSIHSNDPKHPMVILNVYSKVDPEFKLDPETLALGDIPKGKAVLKTIHLWQVSPEPFAVTGVTVQRPEDKDKVKVSFKPIPKAQWAKPDRSEYMVSVTLSPDLPVGPFSSAILIANTCARPNVKNLYVPITATVKAFYTLSKSSMTIGVVRPGQRGVGKLTIKADQPFTLTSLTVSDPALLVRSKPGSAPNSQEILVDVAPMAGAGIKNGELGFTIRKAGSTGAGEGQAYTEKIPIQAVIPKYAGS